MNLVRRAFMGRAAGLGLSAALPVLLPTHAGAQTPSTSYRFSPAPGDWRTFDVTTRIDLPATAAALRLPTGIAPRVLRLDPQRTQGDAGVMLAPGERDLDILANTLTPQRHLGYAVQWFGLAIMVLVVALVLTLRKKR